MMAGILAAIAGTQNVVALWQLLTAALVMTAGVALLLAPYLQRLIASAEQERRDRVRAEERTEIAAHLHDSVLQTLTLIQNRAAEPDVTAALAYQQERELRRWLYGAGDQAEDVSTFRPALERVAEEIEDQYGKVIECIVVGDTELTASTISALAAAREAMVNAAKFAETPIFSVYGEIGAGQLLVFVRDRGVGFEVAAVPADRHGLSGSIQGRIERLGGSAVVRSALGDGTEVRIELPL